MPWRSQGGTGLRPDRHHGEENLVFGPQGTGFFLLLMVVFAALVVWVALAKQVVFRVLAACLAFVPAMAFGIAAVNKFYDYYQTWGGMVNDLTGQGAAAIPKYAAAPGSNKQFDKDIGRVTSLAEDAQVGYLFQTTVIGAHSHLIRNVYVYLPPQYFQKAYAHYRFPVIELLHGSPGSPSAWVDVMGVIPTFLNLLENHPQDASVLVMPDTDGGQQYSLQCLNDPGGIQDMTFVAVDVPADIAKIARVQPPGRAWGVAGYSEGGYCAANIALQLPARYGAAGVLSGYFEPVHSQVPVSSKPGARPRVGNVFAGRPDLQLLNTPRDYITRIPVSQVLPSFFLAAGAANKGDVSQAVQFRTLLLTRTTNVPLDIVPGGGHQASVWRAALGPMLTWMTPQLSAQAAKADAAAAAAAKAAAAARSKAAHPKPSPTHPAAPKK
jgi:enterochelin esterase-like enzyme